MKHNIRINGVVQEIDCELGSGVYDKNGREIFEGDCLTTPCSSGFVYFANGEFALCTHPLKVFRSYEMKIYDD